MLLCSRWVEQCARPLHRVMASAKNLKELQAIWMINALEDLYTRGRTFSEKQKIEYLWNDMFMILKILFPRLVLDS
jgi:hypothetical protein